MAENSTPVNPQFEIPASLKKVLAKIPTPEAIQVLEDIGKAAWVVDNNNNNKASRIEQRLLDNLVALDAKRLAEMLEVKG